jgi:hypothetical protein
VLDYLQGNINLTAKTLVYFLYSEHFLLIFEKFLFGLHLEVYIYFTEETAVRLYSFNSCQVGRSSKFNRNSVSNFGGEICRFAYIHYLSVVHVSYELNVQHTSKF